LLDDGARRVPGRLSKSAALLTHQMREEDARNDRRRAGRAHGLFVTRTGATAQRRLGLVDKIRVGV